MKLGNVFRRFLTGTDGNITVEFVMWVPLLVAILMLATDATMLLMQQTLLFDAARDAARQVALGQRSTTDAQSQMLARFHHGTYAGNVTTDSGYVVSGISVPFSDVMIFGASFLPTYRLGAEVTMWVEQ